MVLSRAITRKKNKNGKQRRQRRNANRRRFPVRNNRSSNSQSLGSLAAKGVRTVLAALPGSNVNKHVADFIFASTGWSDTTTTAVVGQVYNLDPVQITGLAGGFMVNSMLFGASVPSLGLIQPDNSGNPDVASIRTQWTAARISVLKIVARPSGPLGTVSGTWAIGYTPCTDRATTDTLLKSIKGRGVNFQTIRQLPCSAMGDANKPLSIRYFHTPRDGYAYQPHAFDSSATVGLVLIAYQDLMRSTYGEITQVDFQTSIDVSANIVYSARDPDSVVSFTNTVSELTDTPMFLRSQNQIVTFKPEGFKCIYNKKGACTLAGTPSSVNGVSVSFGDQLDRMAID